MQQLQINYKVLSTITEIIRILPIRIKDILDQTDVLYTSTSAYAKQAVSDVQLLQGYVHGVHHFDVVFK